MSIQIHSMKKDGNVKLSENFTLREMQSHDGADEVKVDSFLIDDLQQIRNHFGKAVNINSGYRTVAYNKKVGGVSNSYHTKGQAADIVISGVNARKVAMYAENINCHGVIWYPVKKFTHVDTRPGTFHAICIGSTYYSEPTVTLRKGTKGSNVKWLQYMLFAFQTLIVYGLLMAGREELYWWCLGVVLFVFLLSKALSRVKTLRISELVITLWTACVALYYFQEFRPLAALHEWRSLYEEIFILLLECFVLLRFRNTLTPAVMAGILFLGTAGFNYIGFFRDRYTRWFNYINLGFLGVIYAAAAFCGNNYTYGALLLLGAAFILLMFQERFGMGFRFKNVILVLFVCYMALLWELPAPILKSALLMVAAIGAVAAGFAVKQKSLRITGLSLTLAVCGKMILYDFAAADTFAKMLVFMIVGLIALAISGIYIALEKKIV